MWSICPLFSQSQLNLENNTSTFSYRLDKKTGDITVVNSKNDENGVDVSKKTYSFDKERNITKVVCLKELEELKEQTEYLDMIQ